MIVENYQEAALWLSKGKRKWERPLYTRGLRLRRKPSAGLVSDIEVYCPWTNQALVTYHADNTTTIESKTSPTRWGGTFNPLYSWSQRSVFRDFAGLINVYQRNRKIYVVFQDSKYKQGKQGKCRRCSGSGLVDGYCQTWFCYAGSTCEIEPKIDGFNQQHHKHPCEHGQLTTHSLPKTDKCYACAGSGVRTYGGGYEAMLWDGSPLRLQDGMLVNNKPSELEKVIAAYVSIIS